MIRRSELKYLISDQQRQILIERLKHILPHDKYSQIGKGYFVRSLYFDSHNDRSLRETEEGLLFRKKYRMRIYDLDTKDVKFEIKHKRGEYVFKETATISEDTAIKALNGSYTDLLKYENDVLNRIYADFILENYQPKLIVEYKREAFFIDLFNTRITFDSNIRINNNRFDIFARELNTMPLVLHNKHLLEIKFDQILPEHIRQILQIDSFEKIGFSKYSIGRRI